MIWELSISTSYTLAPNFHDITVFVLFINFHGKNFHDSVIITAHVHFVTKRVTKVTKILHYKVITKGSKLNGSLPVHVGISIFIGYELSASMLNEYSIELD